MNNHFMLEEYSKKIKSALEYEKKNNFINSKGLRYDFSSFILEQTNNFLKVYKSENLEKIVYQFLKYKDIPIEERKKIIFDFENLIELLKIKNIKNKTVTNFWENIDIKNIKGIGEKISQNLYNNNIRTLKDLLYYYPIKHLDYSKKIFIKDCKEGENVTIFGKVIKVDCYYSPNNQNLIILTLTISDETGKIKANWFYFSKYNKYIQEVYKKRFPLNSQVIVSGKVKKDKRYNKFIMENPEIEIIDKFESNNLNNIHTNRIIPIYPVIEGLNLKWLRKTIKIALDNFYNQIKDPIPDFIIKELSLMPLNKAIKEFHFPENIKMLELARYRLVFDELFYMQLGLLYKRKQEEAYLEGTKFNIKSSYVDKFIKNLEFELTNAQKRVFKEICLDLISPKPMRRLLQGDVGSGKTIIALLSSLICIENGYQVGIMVPTEILAEQHYKKFKKWLSFMDINVELISSNITKKNKKTVLENISSGKTNIIIGTHALIQENVTFNNLGLVIIDEQHRFGVTQRATLINKGKSPHLLTMTATPIPRTLALTLYGDLDISIIDELPPCRKPVETFLITNNTKRKKVWDLISKEIIEGKQAYIVFPLIEESDKLTLKAATEEYIYLKNEVFKSFNLGLLHGQMKNSEKDEIMNKFINKEIDILVSTTVIEVGIDVPNATIIVIENAERFGLAQLHQLRGRVGRGSDKSYCFLMSDKNKERLEIMTKTNDGFILSEHDLRLRGPGEFLGTRQSGIPDLILSNLSSDTDTLNIARKYANRLIDIDSELKNFLDIKEKVVEIYYKNSFITLS
jgi:ATP-dependent DNA helicase RecG